MSVKFCPICGVPVKFIREVPDLTFPVEEYLCERHGLCYDTGREILLTRKEWNELMDEFRK